MHNFSYCRRFCVSLFFSYIVVKEKLQIKESVTSMWNSRKISDEWIKSQLGGMRVYVISFYLKKISIYYFMLITPLILMYRIPCTFYYNYYQMEDKLRVLLT
jgi:hypothetical protein